MVKLREDDTTRSITINLASRDLIYHIKARAKDVFKIRVASQVLLLEGEALHNGRRLQHYLRHHKFSFEQTNILTLRNDGPPLIGKSDFVQIFVRTLTGYVRPHWKSARNCNSACPRFAK